MEIHDKQFRAWSEVKYGEGIGLAEREIFPQLLEIAQSSEKILEIGAGNGWIYYFKSREYKQASYEVVKGRNMLLGEVRSYFQQSGLQILELRPVGPVVRPTPTLKINKIVEKILPSRRFGSFLFGLAEKG